MWPRSYFTNGHVMVDGAKMSRARGTLSPSSTPCGRTSLVEPAENKVGEVVRPKTTEELEAERKEKEEEEKEKAALQRAGEEEEKKKKKKKRRM